MAWRRKRVGGSQREVGAGPAEGRNGTPSGRAHVTAQTDASTEDVEKAE